MCCPNGFIKPPPKVARTKKFLWFFCGLFVRETLHDNIYMKPADDDIGTVDEPPGGGGPVTDVMGQVTGADVDLEDRALGEAVVEEDGGVSTRGRTVTLRDFMAFYLFTRKKGSARLLQM